MERWPIQPTEFNPPQSTAAIHDDLCASLIHLLYHNHSGGDVGRIGLWTPTIPETPLAQWRPFPFSLDIARLGFIKYQFRHRGGNFIV